MSDQVPQITDLARRANEIDEDGDVIDPGCWRCRKLGVPCHKPGPAYYAKYPERDPTDKCGLCVRRGRRCDATEPTTGTKRARADDDISENSGAISATNLERQKTIVQGLVDAINEFKPEIAEAKTKLERFALKQVDEIVKQAKEEWNLE